jgi:putative restriction endonuclease
MRFQDEVSRTPAFLVETWQAVAMNLDFELAVREAMFEEIDRRVAMSPDGNLTWDLTERFELGEQMIAMRQARGRGINKPRQLGAALSITTAYRGPNSQAPYEDSMGEDGFPRYKYERTDPLLATNRSLRDAMAARLPLAYFIGVRKAVYRPVYPVYVVGEIESEYEFVLSFARNDVGVDLANLTAPEKVYAARQTRQRLHQPVFREQVLYAYQSRCAVCRLRHAELLDAAHIIGDSEQGGDPVVPNGMALCKLHHAAFDRNFLGVTPTYEVRINSELLLEVDGPMLKHGLQEMHGETIVLPTHNEAKPDPDRLSIRFEHFLAAS